MFVKTNCTFWKFFSMKLSLHGSKSVVYYSNNLPQVRSFRLRPWNIKSCQSLWRNLSPINGKMSKPIDFFGNFVPSKLQLKIQNHRFFNPNVFCRWKLVNRDLAKKTPCSFSKIQVCISNESKNEDQYVRRRYFRIAMQEHNHLFFNRVLILE